MNNENKNPYEEMFDKLDELVEYLRINADRPIHESQVTDEMEKKLEKLERDVDQFKKLSDKIVKLSEAPKKLFNMPIEELTDGMPPEAKRLFERGNALKQQIIEMGGVEEESKETFEDQQLPDIGLETPPKTSAQRRRRKFKGLDGGMKRI